jgi:hypothetical protein
MSILVGATAGLAATGVMSLVMQTAKALGALGEPPPRRLTRKLLRPLGRAAPRGKALDAAALAAHFGFGASMGALHGLLPAGLRTPPGGALFGLGVWAANYAGWLPKVRWMPPPSRDRFGRPTAMIVAHLVYGVALSAFERRLFSPRPRNHVRVVAGSLGTKHDP